LSSSASINEKCSTLEKTEVKGDKAKAISRMKELHIAMGCLCKIEESRKVYRPEGKFFKIFESLIFSLNRKL
jgi:hypothetical protein